MRTKKRMLVKITKSNGWYKKGDTHEVGCYIVFDFHPVGKSCHFELAKGVYGIDVLNCKIIKYLKIK